MNNNNDNDNDNDKNQKTTASAGNDPGKVQGRETQATAGTPSQQGQDKSNKDAAQGNPSPTKS